MEAKNRKNHGSEVTFDAQAFLETAGLSRRVTNYKRNESIYSQGDAAETVMYLQTGGVKLSVVNGSGREDIVAEGPNSQKVSASRRRLSRSLRATLLNPLQDELAWSIAVSTA